MSIDTTRFKKLKAKADKARQVRDRAAGQLDASMSRLENEFGYTTVKEAKAALKKLKTKAAAEEKKYNAAVIAFEESWDEQL